MLAGGIVDCILSYCKAEKLDEQLKELSSLSLGAIWKAGSEHGLDVGWRTHRNAEAARRAVAWGGCAKTENSPEPSVCICGCLGTHFLGVVIVYYNVSCFYRLKSRLEEGGRKYWGVMRKMSRCPSFQFALQAEEVLQQGVKGCKSETLWFMQVRSLAQWQDKSE